MVNPETDIGSMMAKYRRRFAGESVPQMEEYQHYIGLASKLTGDSYMKMHRRIAHAFPSQKLPYVLSKLSEWVHYAEKADNGGMAFNGLFKKYRESR